MAKEVEEKDTEVDGGDTLMSMSHASQFCAVQSCSPCTDRRQSVQAVSNG